MIKIALCDNEPAALNELLALLDQYRTQRGRELVPTIFYNPLDLLAEMGETEAK